MDKLSMTFNGFPKQLLNLKWCKLVGEKQYLSQSILNNIHAQAFYHLCLRYAGKL